MEKFIEKLFDIKKIPTKFIFIIWLSCILILFVPEKFLTKLNVADFLHDYGKYIGITFIISSGFLVVTLISYISRHFKQKKISKQIKAEILKDIALLDSHEKAIIREFFIQGKHTLQLPLDSDTVVGLVNKNIIYCASSTGFVYLHGSYFPYTISKFVLEQLRDEMIDLPQNPTETDKRRIWDARPSWAKEKNRIEDMRNNSWI
jgi:hypothetical protein